MSNRLQTRRERYNTKTSRARLFPVSLVSINFLSDDNLAFLIRSAVCFGAASVKVIGAVPERNKIYNKSGSTLDYVKLEQFSSVEQYLDHLDDKTQVVCAELCEGAQSIFDFKFDFSHHTDIIVGNEEVGIVGVLTERFPSIYIPMPGAGFCLNTSQAGNIMLYEYIKQYELNYHGLCN